MLGIKKAGHLLLTDRVDIWYTYNRNTMGNSE